MKILFISKYATFPGISNPGRQYFLSAALSRLGAKVMLVGSRSIPFNVPPFFGLRRTLSSGNVSLVMMNGPRISLGFSIKRMVSWALFELNLVLSTIFFKRFKPDLVIVSSLSILTFIYGVFFKKVFGIPLVIEVRDIYPATLSAFNKIKPYSITYRLLSLIEKYGYSNADYLISPLEGLGHHAESVLGHSVKFKWIPMGYDDYFFNQILSKDSQGIKNNLKKYKAEGLFTVVYAGSHGYGDRLEFILSVAAELGDFPIRFVFIGDGPLKPKLIADYGHLPNVSFYDSIPKQDVVAVLQECSILINIWHISDLYNYGVSPNKWIDYSLAGRPFLTNLPGDLKVVQNMPNCLTVNDDLCSLKSELLRLSKLPSHLLDEIGASGYEYVVNNLSYDNLARDLISVFNEVVGDKSGIRHRG